MICLKHQQQYGEGEYCVYCGSPYRIYSSAVSTETIMVAEPSDFKVSQKPIDPMPHLIPDIVSNKEDSNS